MDDEENNIIIRNNQSLQVEESSYQPEWTGKFGSADESMIPMKKHIITQQFVRDGFREPKGN